MCKSCDVIIIYQWNTTEIQVLCKHIVPLHLVNVQIKHYFCMFDFVTMKNIQLNFVLFYRLYEFYNKNIFPGIFLLHKL